MADLSIDPAGTNRIKITANDLKAEFRHDSVSFDRTSIELFMNVAGDKISIKIGKQTWEVQDSGTGVRDDSFKVDLVNSVAPTSNADLLVKIEALLDA